MGVDIFSAGSIDETEAGVEAIRYEDPALGAYKKLLLKDNRLHGMILVGDVEDEHIYMDWMRSGTDLGPLRRQLLFPPAQDPGLEVADMPDSETICGCNGVRKGDMIQAIHKHGITTLGQLKQRTKASTSCGSCTGLCEKLLRAVAPDFQEETRTTLCSCVPFSYERLREIVRGQKLKSVEEVLAVYGNRKGCEVCKPALSYMLDMLWCGDHEEDRSARFINDRVHANIQKDGTFSVVPRMRGGVTSPDELRRIADVADKYHIPMVKVTGSQRIDLLGVKKADLPNVWRDLGMPSGQAYTKGVRMVKTCVGTEFCRFGVQDSTNTGIELERRLENLFTPHKVQDGRRRVPAQLCRGDREGSGTGRPGRQLASGGGRCGRQVGSQSRSAGDGRDHRGGARSRRTVSSSTTARMATTWNVATTLWSGWASRRSAKRRCTRRTRRSGTCSIGCIARRRFRSDAWLERDRPANPTQFVQIEPMERIEEAQLV